jgi:hypothetical protein
VNWRAYQEQLGEPPRLRLVDDESASEWVAHVIAEHNARERRRQQVSDFLIGLVVGGWAAAILVWVIR